MGVGGPPVAIKSGAHAPAPSKLFDLSTIPPRLVSRETPISAVSAASPAP